MRRGRWIGLGVVACCLVSSGYLYGQQKAATPSEAAVAAQDLQLSLAEQNLNLVGKAMDLGETTDAGGHDLDKQATESSQSMAQVLAFCARDPALSQALVSNTAKRFYLDKAGAKSAVQVSQVAAEQRFRLSLLQVAQNQRIIALLGQIAKEKG